MFRPIDPSDFPVGRNIDYESAEEVYALQFMSEVASDYVRGLRWAPPIKKVILAFGVSPVLALFLVQFHWAVEGEEDTERWVVVGNLPTMCFETEVATDPALALHLYCAIGQDWADNILAGRDLSESYPIEAKASPANAEDLLSRIAFITDELIPLAQER